MHWLLQQDRADTKLYELLGEKTAADNEKPKKKKEKPAKSEVHVLCIITIGFYFF